MCGQESLTNIPIDSDVPEVWQAPHQTIVLKPCKHLIHRTNPQPKKIPGGLHFAYFLREFTNALKPVHRPFFPQCVWTPCLITFSLTPSKSVWIRPGTGCALLCSVEESHWQFPAFISTSKWSVFFLSNSHKYCEAEIALRALEERYHINANNRRFDKKNSHTQVHRAALPLVG